MEAHQLLLCFPLLSPFGRAPESGKNSQGLPSKGRLDSLPIPPGDVNILLWNTSPTCSKRTPVHRGAAGDLEAMSQNTTQAPPGTEEVWVPTPL